jgi:5S rRNA maturation endonuclease (ribonuclease M5)
MNGNWMRCSRRKPCPVCGKSDWCCYLSSGDLFWCMRTSAGSVAGFERGRTHINGGTAWRPTVEPPPALAMHRDEASVVRSKNRIPWSVIQVDCINEMTEDALEDAASILRIPASALQAYDMGWSSHWKAWTFPMRHPVTKRIQGIRTRTPAGSKFALTGSRQAYFMCTYARRQQRVFLVEGPTDAAAVYSLGLEAIGRASCLHFSPALRESLAGRTVIVVADNDEVGQRGAARTVEYLDKSNVTLISPPTQFKDIRAWIAAGANRQDVEGLAREAIEDAVGKQVSRCAG